MKGRCDLMPLMRVTIMLADAAQESGGKLYILGGGWSVTGPDIPPSALAMKIDVPWDQANMRHTWMLKLVSEDGVPVEIEGQAVRIEGEFEVGRPPGAAPGSYIDVPLAVNFGSLPLAPGRRYVWKLSIDGETNDDWDREFFVRRGLIDDEVSSNHVHGADFSPFQGAESGGCRCADRVDLVARRVQLGGLEREARRPRSARGLPRPRRPRRGTAPLVARAGRPRRSAGRHPPRVAPRQPPRSSRPPFGVPTTLAAIRKTVDALNAAFLAGVSSGITNSTTANHWVGSGAYTADQCVSFESARGQGIVSEHIVTRALESAPGWVDPMTGRVPHGRIYRMTVDEIQTLVTTGQQRARTLSIPVIVRPDGHAQLFLRCH